MQGGTGIEGAGERERPAGSWLMRQTWHDLLFAHWPVDPDAVRPLVPAPLELDTCNGQAWLSLVALRASDVHLRNLPPLPLTSRFRQLNLRTYVKCQGEPGVYFASIDTSNPLAAAGARILYRLPYYYARIRMRARDGEVRWASRRSIPWSGDAELRISYRPTGDVFSPEPGTLAEWLVERYRLFQVTRDGRVQRGEIRHPAWCLWEAAVDIEVNSVAAARGVILAGTPAAAHYVDEMDAVFWPLRAV